MNVLVAEDNIVNQKVIEGLLKKLGHEPDIVSNGHEAILRRERPDFDCDLILMDCEMPKVDGYQATRGIREYEFKHGLSRVPIVALTGHPPDQIRRQCIEAGMNDFLAKPISVRVLARTLERLAKKASVG